MMLDISCRKSSMGRMNFCKCCGAIVESIEGRRSGPSCSLRLRLQARNGFSLVELLAVVLILSVLSATAIPLYMNTRKVAAARACKGNIAAIAAAESACVLRNGKYTNMAGLLTGPESLSSKPTCPLDAQDYTIMAGGAAVTQYVPASDTGGSLGPITIACPNAGTATTGHLGDMGAPSLVTDWQQTMAAIVINSIP